MMTLDGYQINNKIREWVRQVVETYRYSKSN